ncbi:MAG: DNA-binding transcriptional regulator [Phycisphaerales bacterium]|jgi:LacI family transcriptional regulator|nr:DNA-binding transcriptional regulator [Phycisphaerales bacterium]
MDKQDRKNVLVVTGWHEQGRLRGIARYAQNHNWHVVTDMVYHSRPLDGWDGDGIISFLGRHDEYAKFMSKFNVPRVDLGMSFPELEIPRVTTDNEAIGTLAAEHFLDRGFEHFAFVGMWDSQTEIERREAFFERLRRSGFDALDLSHPWEQHADYYPWNVYRRWLAEQFSKLSKPLAVFATHDSVASNVIDAARWADLHVPEQVAVLGIENDEFACQCAAVPISSIDCNTEEIGYQAAETLDKMMHGASAPAAIERVTPLCVEKRKSTDILAVRHVAVARALRFIWDHYPESITTDDILAHVGMSKVGLYNAFDRHLGRSPGQELRRKRMQRAQKLLHTTDLKLAAIASQIGYGSDIAFCNAFKRMFEMTASQYRFATRAGAGPKGKAGGKKGKKK